MLRRVIMHAVAIILVCTLMLTASFCFAAPKSSDASPSPSPSPSASVPDAESGNEQVSGTSSGSSVRVNGAYISGKGVEISSKLKDSLAAEDTSYGAGLRFDIKAAMESDDFSANALEGTVIGIDPGHQLNADNDLESIAPDSNLSKVKQSSGSVGVKSGTPEYKINLAIANKLADILELAGATVVMTHTEVNVDISNSERAEIMNDARVDFWIRLHCESAADKETSGCTILIPSDDALVNPSVSSVRQRNLKGDVVKHEKDDDSNKNEIYIKSLALATAVINEFCSTTGAASLGIVSLSDQTGFNYSDSPVIAIEMGCLSNASDDIRLNRTAYQNACAFGIYRGISQYISIVNDKDFDIDTLADYLDSKEK